MTSLPIHETLPVDPRTNLHLVFDRDVAISHEGDESRRLFDLYYDARLRAAEVDKPQGKELEKIQESVRAWAAETGILDLPEGDEERARMYTTYDRELVLKKIGGLVDYLDQYHSDEVAVEELVATDLFVASAFAMYEDEPVDDRKVMRDADGKFAFVVPARVSRNNTEYGEEVDPVIPALRYLPNELRAQMLLGLPPFVIDTYDYDESGRRGYLVLAPVFEDINEDIPSLSTRLGVAVRIVNDAVDFAHRRFGVQVVGLGATLPAVTKYGQKITNPDVIVTTGHGGTAELVVRTMENGLVVKGGELQSIGVLGLGAIGASVAEVVAERYPHTPINLYDVADAKIRRLTKDHPQRFNVAESDGALVEASQVVISAIVGRFDAAKVSDMEGKIIVDDSQPGSFDPGSVRDLGGTVLWVIGQDADGRIANRTGYDYATMVNGQTDLFGCEAEAAAIAAYIDDLKSRGMGNELSRQIAEKVAVRSAVNVQKVHYISALFKKFGISAAEPQAFGKPVIS